MCCELCYVSYDLCSVELWAVFCELCYVSRELCSVSCGAVFWGNLNAFSTVSPSARDKQLSVELVSPTGIPFRKWWDSSGAERYRERTCAPTNDSPAATGRRLCGCLSVEAVRLSTRHTDIWDQEFQITKCKSFIQLLICAECEVRDSEKALIGLSLNPCIVLNCDLQVYWNAKTRLHW